MGLFSRNKRKYYGLDVGNGGIKLVEIVHNVKANTFTLERYAVTPTPPDTIKNGVVVDRERLKKILTDTRKSFDGKALPVATVLTGQTLIVRQVEVPDMPVAEIRKVIEMQADTYFGIPADDLSSDFHILRSLPGDRLQLLLVGSLKKPIVEFADLLTECGLRPTRIDIEPLAALRSLRMTGAIGSGGEGTATVMLDLGAGTTNLSIFENDELQMVRVISVAGGDFTQAIIDRQGVEWEEAEELKLRWGLDPDSPIYSSVQDVLQRLTRQVAISLEYYQVQNRGMRIEQLSAIGGGARLAGLQGALEQSIGELYERLSLQAPTVMLGNPCNSDLKLGAKIDDKGRELGSVLAVAIGLALGEVAAVATD